MSNVSNVNVDWDLVFADRKAATLLQEFVDGERGFRNVIRSLKGSSKTELYRLERAGTNSARRRAKNALKKLA